MNNVKNDQECRHINAHNGDNMTTREIQIINTQVNDNVFLDIPGHAHTWLILIVPVAVGVKLCLNFIVCYCLEHFYLNSLRR